MHYYIHASSKPSLEPEVYDVNKAFRLRADQAVGNGNSYAYYAASKPSASVNANTTDANGKDFPSPPDKGREILETADPDNPSDGGPHIPGPAGVMDGVTDVQIGGLNHT